MGSKNKLKRFKENLSFNNLFQPTRSELLSNSFKYKGFWKDYFKNNNPIVLELGCGKGEYTCSLAEKYPKKNKQLNNKTKMKPGFFNTIF